MIVTRPPVDALLDDDGIARLQVAVSVLAAALLPTVRDLVGRGFLEPPEAP